MRTSDIVDGIQLEFGDNYDVRLEKQENVKEILSECPELFPMLCFEYTADSTFMTNECDTSFLTDDTYDTDWIVVSDECSVLAVLCILDTFYRLEIQAFEVNNLERFKGLGRRILTTIEDIVSENGDITVVIHPFDSVSTSFWEHMGYTEGNPNEYLKKIKK